MIRMIPKNLDSLCRHFEDELDFQQIILLLSDWYFLKLEVSEINVALKLISIKDYSLLKKSDFAHYLRVLQFLIKLSKNIRFSTPNVFVVCCLWSDIDFDSNRFLFGLQIKMSFSFLLSIPMSWLILSFFQMIFCVFIHFECSRQIHQIQVKCRAFCSKRDSHFFMLIFDQSLNWISIFLSSWFSPLDVLLLVLSFMLN